MHLRIGFLRDKDALLGSVSDSVAGRVGDGTTQLEALRRCHLSKNMELGRIGFCYTMADNVCQLCR